MIMEIIFVENKNEWNEFVNKEGPQSGLFLQTWEWGDFQKVLGNTIYRIAITKDGEWIGSAQIIVKNLPFGMIYLSCPKGPVAKKIDGEFFEVLTNFAKEQNALFLRIEPNVVPNYSLEKLKSTNICKVKNIHPADTLITNLLISNEDLLSQMHQKTRYNIKIAEKKEVQILFNGIDFDEVWSLFETTSKRGEFGVHSKKYYKLMLQELSESKNCQVFLATAKYENEFLAVNIMVDSNNTRTYLHGASSNKNRNIMSPYLLHWELMKDAKEKGFAFYDWWGISPQNSKNHSWAGITRFKKGFGGDSVNSFGTFDLIIFNFKYKIYFFARILNQLQRLFH